jgi:hypothetical protein
MTKPTGCIAAASSSVKPGTDAMTAGSIASSEGAAGGAEVGVETKMAMI